MAADSVDSKVASKVDELVDWKAEQWADETVALQAEQWAVLSDDDSVAEMVD
jgi:hypothetical protein